MLTSREAHRGPLLIGHGVHRGPLLISRLVLARGFQTLDVLIAANADLLLVNAALLLARWPGFVSMLSGLTLHLGLGLCLLRSARRCW